MNVFEEIVSPDLLVRRVNLSANHVISETEIPRANEPMQLDLFCDVSREMEKKDSENAMLEREKHRQHTILELQKKYGKNAVMKGMNLQEGATTLERNKQIGGHKA